MTDETVLVPTGAGPARIVRRAGERGTLVLGHGAGGLGWSADILAVRDAAGARGWGSVLVDQPWRVAGRSVATRPPVLDTGWRDVLVALGAPHRPLVAVGRSAGARVACRTCAATGVDAVLCISFPLHPPGQPERSRAEELRTPTRIGLELRVIQGMRDPFGTPEEVRLALCGGGDVVGVEGRHSLRDTTSVVAAALGWLESVEAR